ncbi:MAG TPA: tripartite tricarboxylate transporter permease, partial [Rhodospirillales bacterium]
NPVVIGAMLIALPIGVVVGLLPGLSGLTAFAFLIPFTFGASPLVGLAFLLASYAAVSQGGSITAIILGVPGEVPNAATVIDGYPMAKAGRGQQALAISFVASTVGGLLTTVLSIFIMPWLAEVSYHMHSVEMIVIMLFGISLIASIAARDTLKGLIAGFLGLMIGLIGTDHVYATPRGTFGLLELYDGVPLIPALVGLFAVSEAFMIIEQRSILTEKGLNILRGAGWSATLEGVTIALRRWWHITWTGLIGLVIGVIPGAGAAIASFVAYQQSRSFSRTPELYGTGHPEGLIAPESANNGVTAGTLIPMFILGIPGGATAAVMLVVLQYQGVNIGPTLFEQRPEIGYGVFIVMAVTYLLMMVTILPLARYMPRVTMARTVYLAPLIISFTLVGSFVPRDYVFDMFLGLLFGVIGYIGRRTGYHVAAILIGVILGPMLEQYFLRAMKMADGDLMVLFSSNIGNALWAALIVSVALPFALEYKRNRQRAAGTA